MIEERTENNLIDLPPFPGEREIHRKAGFRISSFQRASCYPALIKPYKRIFRFYSLSHLIEGEGWFWTPGGGRRKFTAGQGVLIAPGDIHCYGGDGTEYVEDSLCFNGAMTSFLRETGILRTDLLNIGLDRRLLPIMDLAGDPSDDGQLKANSECISLLTDLYLENRRFGQVLSHEDSLNRLIRDLQKNPGYWRSVEEMAEYCSISKNYFRTLFRNKTGRSPREYQEELRINRALEQIVLAGSSITAIAGSLGYRDVYHFSKVFRKNTGMSPRSYRQQHSISHKTSSL